MRAQMPTARQSEVASAVESTMSNDDDDGFNDDDGEHGDEDVLRAFIPAHFICTDR